VQDTDQPRTTVRRSGYRRSGRADDHQLAGRPSHQPGPGRPELQRGEVATPAAAGVLRASRSDPTPGNGSPAHSDSAYSKGAGLSCRGTALRPTPTAPRSATVPGVGRHVQRLPQPRYVSAQVRWTVRRPAGQGLRLARGAAASRPTRTRPACHANRPPARIRQRRDKGTDPAPARRRPYPTRDVNGPNRPIVNQP